MGRNKTAKKILTVILALAFTLAGVSAAYAAPVTELTATTSKANTLTLKWPSVTGASSYFVTCESEEAASDIGSAIWASYVTKTSVTYTDVPAGDYDVWVTATGPDGAEVKYNAKVTVKWGVKPAKTSGGFKISWGSVFGAAYYKVYVTASGGAAYGVRTTGSSAAFSVPGGAYKVQVQAFSSSGKTLQTYASTFIF